MSAPAALVRLVEPWSQLYADSKVLPTVIVYAHITALLLAGGLAITIDRGTLRASHSSTEQRVRHLDALSAAHRFVLGGLALSAITGVLLFTADLETYFTSRIFWTKATLIVLLLLNGYMMTRAERALRSAPENEDAEWRRLRRTAVISLVLWFAIPLFGAALAEAL